MSAARPQQFSGSAGGRSENDVLRLEIERLRSFVEVRVQAQENMLRAMVVESAARAREALEGRIQLAAREAIAFAHQGLEHHEAALRALGRRLAEMAREPCEVETACPTPPGVGLYALGVPLGEASDCQRLEVGDATDPAFLSALAHLPILPGGAARLVAAHVIEFAPMAALSERILPHWRSRLAPGGELVIVTLDGPAWAAELLRAEGGFEAMRRRLGADGGGRPLCNLFDAAGLAALLRGAGFAPDAAEVAGSQLRIVARPAAA
ncbi:MAG: hypothetical protein KGM15_06005 [Pseudomonadota bacterium]|nr:hypothetical protein [Pseudomonadota bacterium]